MTADGQLFEFLHVGGAVCSRQLSSFALVVHVCCEVDRRVCLLLTVLSGVYVYGGKERTSGERLSPSLSGEFFPPPSSIGKEVLG